MVDVGYCINGKHDVMKNVTPISNTKTEHLCFMQADGEEQYALKKENIEYVIPSLYTEEKMIELCQKVDPPNKEIKHFEDIIDSEIERMTDEYYKIGISWNNNKPCSYDNLLRADGALRELEELKRKINDNT